jgi:hypothetical protein
MPELSRFFGIIIRMFVEVGESHHVPHFHAYYQEDIAVFSIDPIELISGRLPKRQQRLVEAWAELQRRSYCPIGSAYRLAGVPFLLSH